MTFLSLTKINYASRIESSIVSNDILVGLKTRNFLSLIKAKYIKNKMHFSPSRIDPPLNT